MKTLNTIFPQDKIDSVEADLSSPAGRASYFSQCWEEWEPNNVEMPWTLDIIRNNPHSSRAVYQVPSFVREFAFNHGLEEFWDFIVKGNNVRFKDSDMAFYFRLSI